MNEPAHKQFKDQPNKDAFTFKVKCHRDDEKEVRTWLQGEKEKVSIGATFLKETSEVFRNIEVDQISQKVDDIIKYELNDKTKEEQEAEEEEEEIEEEEEMNEDIGGGDEDPKTDDNEAEDNNIKNLGKYDNIFQPHEQICNDD